MSEEIFVAGKSYVSSKRASVLSGYAQDYIGQLARGGLIDAQRVGGLWYVAMDSLNGYRTNSEGYKPQPPVAVAVGAEAESVVSFDGKDYVTASRAAKLTGYNQDYVGQLARAGKILSRQIGNRWYVDREGLMRHKQEKDALLAAVQAESVGISRPTAPILPQEPRKQPEEPLLSYRSETNDLMPVLATKPEEPAYAAASEGGQHIAIRVLAERPKGTPQAPKPVSVPSKRRTRVTGKALAGALTIIVVLSVGMSTLKEGSTYAVFTGEGAAAVSPDGLSASAFRAVGALSEWLANLVTNEVVYIRPQ